MFPTAPELEALKAQIEAMILKDSEGFFDDPKEDQDLQITVRIACEFQVFLQSSSDPPEREEAEYMAGTIRSELDWFFSMAQTGGNLTGLQLRAGFGTELPNNFSTLRATYNSIFQQLLQCTHSVKAVGLLLSLVQMTFLFMTAYFPSFASFNPE